MHIIKEHRLEAGLTQADVARATGIAPSNISAIESGNRKISAETQNRILDAIGRPSVVLREQREAILRVIAESGCTDPRVFGSIVRGEDRPKSDIDIVVHPDYQRAMEFVTLPRRLEELLGVRVDVLSDQAKGRRMPAILALASPL